MSRMYTIVYDLSNFYMKLPGQSCETKLTPQVADF